MAFENELAPNIVNSGIGDGNHQGRMAHLPDDLVPDEIVGPIFDRAQESSLVLRMGQQIPVTYGETIIPVNTRRPEVGQVGTGTSNAQREGHEKPLSGVGWGTRSFSPIKLATIVTASHEFAMNNPMGLFTQMQNDLAFAIGRGIDLAVFHGRQPINGALLQGIDTQNVLANTTNELFLDQPDVPLLEQLIEGYELSTNNFDQHREDFEFSGWAADPRIRARMARTMIQRNDSDNVMDPRDVNLSSPIGNALGFPVWYGMGVGGKLGANADTGVRLIGGDWSQLRYGYADQIRVKVTDQATITDAGGQAVSMWQTNQVAILIEVTFGWVVGELDAFVKLNETGYVAPTEPVA